MINKQTILITGGLGYIGLPTIYKLFQKGYRIIVFDIASLDMSFFDEMPIEYMNADILNKEKLVLAMRHYHPDIVIHFAAKISVEESEIKKKLYFDTNVTGTKHILEAMKVSGCRKLIFSSSASVYAPRSWYAKTKRQGERLIQKSKGIRYAILRYFNVVGEEPILRNTKLIPSAIRVAMGFQKRLCVYGHSYPTIDGTAIRDYISLPDVVDANCKALDYLLRDNGNMICDIGSGIGTSNLEVVLAVGKQFGKEIPIIYKKPRKEAIISVADIEPAKKMLNWAPKYSNISGIINGLISFQKTPRRF